MTENGRIGNDEPPEPPRRLFGVTTSLSKSCGSSRTKMAHSSQSLLSVFASPRRLALFAVLATAAVPSAADARIGGYDGVWNVTFATTRGNCSSGYSVPFTVSGSRVSSAGGGRVSGTVNRGGAAGLAARRGQAPGGASSPETSAAAPGRRRGAKNKTARRRSGRAVETSAVTSRRQRGARTMTT